MRPRLYTEIPKDGDNWRFVRSGPSGLEPVPEGAGIPSGADVVVFVPGTEVTAHRVRAAARRPVELTRLATFAIEDDLAVPVGSGRCRVPDSLCRVAHSHAALAGPA